jgi:predicted small secreted protein
MSHSTARSVSRFALLVYAAATLAACNDTTGPTSDGPSAASTSPAGPTSQVSPTSPDGPKLAAAVITSNWGQVGDVRTPYPSVRCWGTSAGGSRRLSLLGATAYPAQMMTSGEQVSQQVFLYKWTSTGWTAFPPKIATKSVGPVTMPTVTFSSLTPGYYKVVTRFTWSIYTASGWSAIGSKVVDYSTAKDYTGAFGGQAGPGYCTLP